MPEDIDLPAVADGVRSSVARLNRRLRAEGGLRDFTASQSAVILRIHADGPATTSDLARAEGMRPQSMSSLIASLEAAGILARRADPADRRASVVFITDSAMQSITESRAAKQGWLVRTMEARLSEAEQRTLADASAIIERLLEQAQ